MKLFGLLLVLAGLLVVGCSDQVSQSGNASQADSMEVIPVTYAVKVPTMECPVYCWPNVKKALEAEQGVKEVTLAEQKDDSVIDNPVVYVAADRGFDAQHAIDALAGVGFKGATVSEQP